MLRETGLDELLLRTATRWRDHGRVFSGLPPGHESSRSTAINQDDLPEFQAILKRVGEVGLKGLAAEERQALLALPFADRRPASIGLDRRELRGARARGAAPFRREPPGEPARRVEFFDPERYNGAATLQDNILFGKIVTGQAGANERITRLVREVLEELDLRLMVVKNGLDYQVGVGGARPPCLTGRRSPWCALLKRPVVLVFDQAAAVLDPTTQLRVVENVLHERKGKTVVGAVAPGVRRPLRYRAGDGARPARGARRVRRAEKENRMSLEQEVELIRQFPSSPRSSRRCRSSFASAPSD